MQTLQKTSLLQDDEKQVGVLYHRLLESWNNQQVEDYVALFSQECNIVGFDGSQMNGPDSIRRELAEIFASHNVGAYVAIIREVRAVSPDIFLLRAAAGMVPDGQHDINPKVNAIQTLIAQKEDDEFRIVLFQNTPAAFHSRPELVEQLTSELQHMLNKQRN